MNKKWLKNTGLLFVPAGIKYALPKVFKVAVRAA